MTSRIRDDLLARLGSEAVRTLCREFGVKELAVFGSLLGEEFSEGSDVDLLVEFKPEARTGFLRLAGLADELTQVLARQVDLVSKKELKPLIRDQVIGSAHLVYAV